MEDDCEFEHSELSGLFERDGMKVEVEIYRLLGTSDSWQLEVVNENGGCTRWYTRYQDEREAYQVFLAVIEKDGISFFYRSKRECRH